MRRYELEIKLSLSWGLRGAGKSGGMLPQVISLPLTMSRIEVFSGIKPPAQLLQAATVTTTTTNTSANVPSTTNGNGATPRPPPRPSTNGPRTGQRTSYDDAPPSYDEAMAESLAGPQDRPAYSGVTAENAPSTMPPDKSARH
ncbi:hypothetical protein O1611_g9491 [Lasiodiplodia mahajangana]|uniref:Uncharacterized protein n=1 Tax=Lasiodiplodia mahajangana TaxID=1108764 RepID=A0ACC2J951_9PEZI|nr:hypothetical protein O1611_g9491 [Lasiodiplodia mahajangana]